MARLRAEPTPFDIVTDIRWGGGSSSLCDITLGSVSICWGQFTYLSVDLHCNVRINVCVKQNLFSHRCCFFPLLPFVALHCPTDFQTSTARRRNQRRGAASCSESKVTA